MTTITIELNDELHQRLQATAVQQGISTDRLVQQWLYERLSREFLNASDRALEVLRQAGLLAESSRTKTDGAASNMTLHDIRAALTRSGQVSNERNLATETLRQAGLLAELTPAEQECAAQCTITLDEVRTALGRGGPPLSEIILEQRGPKV